MSEDIIKLQHQMKQNNDELQNFLRDMGNWAKEIGVKDEQLRKRKAESREKKFQPLRSVDELRNSVQLKAPDEDDDEKEEKKCKVNTRIPSNAYDAWAKFDVEKALEEVDAADGDGNAGQDTVELTEEMKLQKAIVEKDKGNEYFKQGKFSEAVSSYTNGMKCDPKNAVLPANRAMAYLKMKDWSLAESDCTLAISLDPTYVKAYQRRATARKNMLNYGKSMADFQKVVELEPSNKQAQAEIEELRFRMKNAPTEGKKKEAGRKSSSKTFSKNLKEKYSKPIEPSIPGQVMPVHLPVHKRSSGPFKKIEIVEISNSSEKLNDFVLTECKEQVTTARPKIEVLNDDASEPTCDQDETAANNAPEKSDAATKSLGETKRVEAEINEGRNVVFSRTKPTLKKPSTSVQFTNVWQQLKEHEDQFAYLNLLSVADYPRVFKHSMEPAVFSSIIHALVNFPQISKPLVGISKVPRISALVMFLEDKEKSLLRSLIEKLENDPLDISKSDLDIVKNCFLD